MESLYVRFRSLRPLAFLIVAFFVIGPFAEQKNEATAQQATLTVSQPQLERLYGAVFHRPADEGALGYVGYDLDFVLDEFVKSAEHAHYTKVFEQVKALEDAIRILQNLQTDLLDDRLAAIDEVARNDIKTWAETLPPIERTSEPGAVVDDVCVLQNECIGRKPSSVYRCDASGAYNSAGASYCRCGDTCAVEAATFTDPVLGGVCTLDNACLGKSPGDSFRCATDKTYSETADNICACQSDCSVALRAGPDCSETSDDVCPSWCAAGSDYDCCTVKTGNWQWFEGRGCYEVVSQDRVCASYFRRIGSLRMIQGTWFNDLTSISSKDACGNAFAGVLLEKNCAQPDGEYIEIVLIDKAKHTYDMPVIDQEAEFVASQACIL